MSSVKSGDLVGCNGVRFGEYTKFSRNVSTPSAVCNIKPRKIPAEAWDKLQWSKCSPLLKYVTLLHPHTQTHKGYEEWCLLGCYAVWLL
jgi:hypothetical protein